MYLIESGAVRVLKGTGASETEVGVGRPGQLLGEISFIDNGTPSGSVVAQSDVQAIGLSKARLAALVAQSPMLGVHVNQALAILLASRLRETSGRSAMLLAWL